MSCNWVKLKDVYTLKKTALAQLVSDEQLATKLASICSLQSIHKKDRNGLATFKIYHQPTTDRNLIKRLPATVCKPELSLIKSVLTKEDRKSYVTEFEISTDVLRSCVVESILATNGNHGVSSDLHKFSMDESGDVIEVAKQNIAIDFSSPNIAKPFHAGHLRSTVIGGYISRLKKALGHNVTGINYFGDWGTQFGFRRFGDDGLLQSSPLTHLYDIYVKTNDLAQSDPSILQEANTAMSDLENGEKTVQDLWMKFKDASVDSYSQIYQKLGISFDAYEWESEYHVEAIKLCDQLLQSKVLYRSESEELNGAVVVKFPIGSATRELVLQKNTGMSLYISRDIAAFLNRMRNYHCDKILYVVERGQEYHFSNLTHIIDHLGLLPKEASKSAGDIIEHVKFGRVSGMSTRKGNVVRLADILDEAKERMAEKMTLTTTTKSGITESPFVAEQLSISAVIVYELKLSRHKGYNFYWDNVLDVRADTGPHLQISHARLYSLEEKCGVSLNKEADLSPLVELETARLFIHLAKYDEIIKMSDSRLESHILVRYLFDLCHFTNAALKTLKVKGERKEVAEARLLMFHCARLTLANGLNLLGIQPLNQV